MVVFTKTHPRYGRALRFYPKLNMIAGLSNGPTSSVWKFTRINKNSTANPTGIPFKDVTEDNVTDWSFTTVTLLVKADFGVVGSCTYEFALDPSSDALKF